MDLTIISAIEAAMRLVNPLARPSAYLDPGSGSYLLQLLIAGALGALFALRVYWKRVRRFLLRLIGKGKEEEGEG